MDRYVSLQDLANYAGVAKSTVSLALRDDPRVRDSTRARILRAAEELGYQSDPTVSALASRRWKANAGRGAVIARLYEHIPEQGYQRQLWDGAKEHAEALGYSIDDICAPRVGSAERLEQVLVSRGIRGALIFPFSQWTDIERVSFQRLTATLVDAGSIDLPLNRVRSHVAANVRLCYRQACAAGYEHIGLYMPMNKERMTELDQSALGAISFCYDYLSEERCRIPHFAPPPSWEDGIRELRKWVAAHEIDCIIGWNPGVLQFIQGTGLVVPKDVAFITIKKDSPEDGLAGLTRSPSHQAGLAVDMLDRQIRYNKLGSPERRVTALIEDQWRDGDTMPVKAENPAVSGQHTSASAL